MLRLSMSSQHLSGSHDQCARHTIGWQQSAAQAADNAAGGLYDMVIAR